MYLGVVRFKDGVLGFSKRYGEEDGVVWVRAVIIDNLRIDNSAGGTEYFIARYVLPFNDGVTALGAGDNVHVHDPIFSLKLKGEEWKSYRDSRFYAPGLKALWEKSGGRLPIWYGGANSRGIDWEEWEKGRGSDAIGLMRLVVPNTSK